jgi:hypothetical protein
MSEIGLGIGRAAYADGTVEIEAIYWYDQEGIRYQTAEEIAKETQQQLDKERELLERYRQQFGELPE